MTQRDPTVNWMEVAVNEATDAINELRKDMGVRTAELAAVKTLESLGYEWNGGELWKPPLGEAPEYIKQEPRATYEKVTFDKLSEAFEEHEEAPLYAGGKLSLKMDSTVVFNTFKSGGEFYRKVEITPMRAAKNAIMEFCYYSDVRVKSEFDTDVVTDWQGMQSVIKGKEKLSLYDIDVDKLISMCRATVEAYDGVAK